MEEERNLRSGRKYRSEKFREHKKGIFRKSAAS